MKKTFLISLFVSFSLFLRAEVGYLGAGWNFSSGSFKNFNYVIDRYNETRDYLNDDMDKLHYNGGITIDFGVMMPYFQGGFGLQWNRAKMQATGVVNDIEFQRDLWFRSFNFPLELGIALGEEGIVTIPGIGLNFMFWHYLTRAAEKNDIEDEEFIESDTDVGMQIKFYTKFVFGGIEDAGFGLVLEPFYNLGFLGCDMTNMNQILNPNTYYDDPIKQEKFSNYGVRLMALYKFGG